MKKKWMLLALVCLMLIFCAGNAAVADTTTSSITVSDTDYTLFTGFTATDGTAVDSAFVYGNVVDGNTSTSWHPQSSDMFVEFNTDDPIIPKGYIFNTYMEGNFYPQAWVLKAKADASDDWTMLSSYSGQSLSSGQEFQYACSNNGDTPYKYFCFEASNTAENIWLTEIRLYGSVPDVYYTHLTAKAATCTEAGIKVDCYQRNDGKYFTDETGTTELAESDVIDPIKPHTGEHHDATDVNIEYWQCSMCSKYFSDEGCTTEITEEQTKIYRTITIDGGISGLVTSNVNQALAGATVTLTVSHLIDASTLKVNNGEVELTDIGSNQYTFTVPADNVTVTAEILSTYSFSLPDNMEMVSATNEADGNGKYISGTVITFAPSLRYSASNVSDGTNTLEPNANGVYTVTIDNANINITATVVGSSTLYLAGATSDFTAADGETLVGSTSHTVTIANGANITLNNATITGGIVCEGTATITLDGTNSVSVVQYKKAGIQIGGSGTTLTIRGDGSLTVTGGSAAAGIGLGRTWDASVTAGAIVIEGGTVNASGDIGIGIGTVGNSQTATIDGISIKGGTVNASLGKGNIYYGSTATVGYIKIYDTIDMVDASKITETVTYMHVDGESATDVTANKTDYFTIGENGDRRIIVPKDDTDYTITIAEGIEHGTLSAAATAKYMQTVTVTATPAFGYRFVRLIVKDAQNNDVASTGNTFQMPKGGATVSAVFEQGVHGTTEFVWGYFEPGGFVNEATIYDGVTTVNIQQTGQSYNILKYDEYTYSNFRLDNDTYEANIPYAGGTGEFYGAGNATNFSLNYDGETGYYDITMTDAGNGKWSVSILPTAAQMDVVPDQTYTGSAITPEPLVIAGSLSLTKGEDYEYSYENNINVGTATVRATFQGDYESLGYVEKTFTIKPSTIMLNVTGGGMVTIGDKSASDGEAFGVMSEKGASVVLTLAPESGNTVRSVEYGYTNSKGTNRSGAKLPISDGTATLTVPNDLKDGTGVTVAVTFAPALPGGADEASAVALTDATVTDLAGGWYKVESDITFDHTLNLLGDTHLTIADGATMTVSTATSRGIDSDYTLTVGGAGALSVTASGSYPIAVRVGNYVQTGATVTASGFIGIRCSDDFDADVTNDLTFSGGQLTVTGTSDGIWADGTITLSCTNGSDFIQASSYSGTVAIADGKVLTDGTSFYRGTLTSEEITAIAGMMLVARYSITIASSIEHGTVALSGDQTSFAQGDTVTLTVEPYAGYTLASLTCTRDGSEPIEIQLSSGDYTFEMPDSDVTVSAVFWRNIDYAVRIYLDGMEASSIPDSEYTAGFPYMGSEIIPVVTVEDYLDSSDEKVLTSGTDFTVNYANNMGTAEELTMASATIVGIGDYAGETTVYFRIAPYNIADCEIGGTLEAYDDGYGPYYPLSENVEVWYGETQLELDTDYTIELDTDIDIYSYVVGEQYQATFTGIGDWAGTQTFTFTFVALHHTVVFDPGDGGIGTMNDGNVANNGGSAGRYVLPECTFIPPYGYEFDHWEVYYDNIEENPVKQPGDYFTAPYIWGVYDMQTITVTAIWRDKEHYTITVSGLEHGSIMVNGFEVELNDDVLTVYEDDVITVVPTRGYLLDDVTVTDESGEYVTVQNDGFTMPGGNVQVYVTFTKVTFGTPDFTMPAALVTIEESAFEGNTNISIVDAHTVTIIGKDAFKGCTGLKQIKLSANCNIDSTAFSGCGTVYIFAPAGGSTEAFCIGKSNLIFIAEDETLSSITDDSGPIYSFPSGKTLP